MQIDLTGRSALVTGSTQGIGLAIARGLAGAGAKVGINGRSEKSVSAAIDQLHSRLPDAELVAVPADVSGEEGAAQVARLLPDIDVLVNNLGIFESRPALEINDDEWRHYFEVNVLSGVRLTRQCLPGKMERQWGRVLFIASGSSSPRRSRTW